MEISLSQMDPDQKNEVSHRGIAIRKLIAHIKKSSMKA
jgi:inosine/xanthosine triphosphate pyrophosphatase family protein